MKPKSIIPKLIKGLLWANDRLSYPGQLLAKSLKKVAPLLKIGKTVTLIVLVPIYKLYLSGQRLVISFYRPAKNKVLYFFINRAVPTLSIVAIGALTIIINLTLEEVHAESEEFGQQSLLIQFASPDPIIITEDYLPPAPHTPSLSAVSVTASLSAPLFSPLPLPVAETLHFASAVNQIVPDNSTTSLSSPIAPGFRSEIITYKVKSGDTLSTIAQNFGISLQTILWANNLTLRSVLKLNQELTILPISGVKHLVKSGDTLLAIAKKYDVAPDLIQSQNALNSDSKLSIGQSLLIPGGKLIYTTPPSRSSTAVTGIFTAAPPGSGADRALSAGASMIWPTDGHYIVRGLSKFHNGVDIDCNGHANGTSTNDIYATLDGTVSISGWRAGYGYSVDINHGNGLMTRYGHLYSLYVKAGEAVSGGAPLGRCGSTGNSSGTHLHFEVRINGVNKNPANYLNYR